MSYTYDKNDLFGFLNSKGYEAKEKGSELQFKYCPYCEGGSAKDKNTFSVNINNGAFKCLRASCSEQGHFVKLARDFGYTSIFNAVEERQYKRLPQKQPTTTEKAYEYLSKRGIGKATAEKYKITTRKDNDKTLVFPFYDENKELVYIKYRKTDFQKGKDKCKEWCEKDTKPILFGMGQCEDFETLVITEGQLDSLTLSHCSIKNAVSVPSGCNNFTWIKLCWDWLIKFKEIIVFGDNEKGKITLVDEIEKRLPVKIKVVRNEDYLGEKDANDIFNKFGKQAILDCIARAERRTVKNVKDLSEVRKVDLSSQKRVKTNIKELDRVIGGLFYGQLIILSGKCGEGKSTFMSQLMCEALEQNESIFVYSGELSDYHFKSWIDLQLAGKENIVASENEYYEMVYRIPDNISKKINKWYRGRAYIYDNNCLSQSSDEFEGLINTIETVIRQYGVKVICIDNLMTAMETITEQNNLFLAQSNFVGKLKNIANKYNVIVILVAHPKKSNNTGFSNETISGSSDITNKADIVMCYQRAENEMYDSEISITKNRLTGKKAEGKNKIQLCFSPETKRISSISDTKTKHYSWEKPDLNIIFDEYIEIV